MADEPNPPKPAPAAHGQFVQAIGTVEPEEVVKVGSTVAGTIVSVSVNFSSVVHQGEVLAQIDGSAFAVRLDMAKASFNQAQANLAMQQAEYEFASRSLERLKAMVNTGAATHEMLDAEQFHAIRARAAVDSAKAEVRLRETAVQLAMLDLAGTKILSPIDGVILDRRVTAGQSVLAGNPGSLFVIAKDLRRMQLLLSVFERDIVKIHPGQEVQFKLAAFKDQTFTGKVARVRLHAAANPNGAYIVEVDFNNADLRVFPHMTADAEIAVGRGDDTRN
jgi:HlyD family secretion protein